MPSSTEVITLGEVGYRVRVAGSGPTIAMHPSLGRPGADFDQLAAELATAGYRTVVIDPPGVATPPDDRPGLTLGALAGDLWAVLDRLGVSSAVLLGHAFGNRVVRAASAERPDRVAALVLLACGGETRMPEPVRERFVQCFDESLDRDERVAAVRDSFFAALEPPASWVDGWYPEVAQRQSAAVAATEFAVYAVGGRAPALVVQGLDDVLAPPVNAWNLVARRPDTRVVGLPACGHAILPEQPVAVRDAVLSFLRERGPAPA